MISVRQIIVGLGLAFTAYLAARGLWWTAPVPRPLVLIAALSLYLVTTWLCIFWEQRRRQSEEPDGKSDGRRMTAGSRTTLPSWAGVLALASAFIVPSAIAVDGSADPPRVRITVRDTGAGFDLDRVPHDRLGIRASIFARVAAVGGTSSIESDADGTTVRLRWREVAA